MNLLPHRLLVTWATLAFLLIVITQQSHANTHGDCTLDELKEKARSACDHLSEKLGNDTRDPFHKGRDSLGYHLSHGSTVRSRRHTYGSSHHKHEYHKLNTHITLGRKAYLEVSYNPELYSLVEQAHGPEKSVSEWTTHFLSSKRLHEGGLVNDNTRYNVEDNNDVEAPVFVPVHHRGRRDSVKKEESLEAIRKRRHQDVHAKISYCCEHFDSSRCRDMLCYI